MAMFVKRKGPDGRLGWQARVRKPRAPVLVTRPLASIRGKDIADYIRERGVAGAAPDTVRLELARLSHLFTIARSAWGMAQGQLKPDFEACGRYLGVPQTLRASEIQTDILAPQQNLWVDSGSGRAPSTGMQGDFHGVVGPKAEGFSGGQFCLGVKTLHDSVGELTFCAEPVE